MRSNSFILLNTPLTDPLFLACNDLICDQSEETFSRFCRVVFQKNAQDDLRKYFSDLVLYDVNAFSVASAKGERSDRLDRAYRHDLAIVQELLRSVPESEFYRLDSRSLFDFADDEVEALRKLYRRNGYGDRMYSRAFRFTNGALLPVTHPSPVTVEDLKGYTREKKTVEDNLLSFLGGYPYSNMLLYGDRGTGKSSTVHAMLNKYFDRGLRIVELHREQLGDLTELKRTLIDDPLHFIIFIDDLSLEENDEKISTLKAALEGSLEGHGDNTLIIATSNRRHIVRESFTERDTSVHASDQLQEQLSLSDRFGISVYFPTTGKAEYLDVVKKLAADRSLAVDENVLCDLAERWALRKGGRSPRRAKQFIDLACALTAQGKAIEF
ncbi:MAG: ATP-binding protein [Christensenellaceae bacterium]